ncbi:MAG: type II toxin-antitoxin system PemK/MazF family toxin [Candidatus Hydrogenedentes bacterium]|nr:type II toxin-antitoxin system PemK/MazF family toxin [Candidatus Hydrogenedentota bacterium]
MKEGDIVLANLPQVDAATKRRPVLLLRELPSFGDFLVCGISTQLHQAVTGFDEIISRSDDDYQSSGLLAPSVVRLNYLGVVARHCIPGKIGSIHKSRYRRLIENLSRHLLAAIAEEASGDSESDTCA